MSQQVIEQGAQLKALNLVNSSRLLGLSSDADTSSGLVAFLLKENDQVNIHIHESATTRRTTQVTRCGGVSNPVFATMLPGADLSLLYLKDGKVFAAPLEFPGGDAQLVAEFALPVEGFKVFVNAQNQIMMVLVFDVYTHLATLEETGR